MSKWTGADTTAERVFAQFAMQRASVVVAMQDEPGTLPFSMDGTVAERIATCINVFHGQDKIGKEMCGSFVKQIDTPFTSEHGNGGNAGYEVMVDMGRHELPVIVRAYVVREYCRPHVVATIQHGTHGWQAFSRDVNEAISNTFDMAAEESETIAAMCEPEYIEPVSFLQAAE